jgi:hypothetical protein
MPSYPFIVQVKKLWGTTKGITLWPFVFITDKKSRTLIEHEKIHIKQAENGWVIGFYLKYLYYHFTKGYKNNPYEIEAYAHQDDWRK